MRSTVDEKGLPRSTASGRKRKQRKKDSVFQRIYDALEAVFSSQRKFFEEVGSRKAEKTSENSKNDTARSDKSSELDSKPGTQPEGVGFTAPETKAGNIFRLLNRLGRTFVIVVNVILISEIRHRLT